MRRCQTCQLVKNVTNTCNCGRILCETCTEYIGCCGTKPAAIVTRHEFGPPLDHDEIDEDGSTVEEPTPTVPEESITSLFDDGLPAKDADWELWIDIGGSD